MVIFVQSCDESRKAHIDAQQAYNGLKSDWANERWRWRQSLVVFFCCFFYHFKQLCALYLTAAKSLCLDWWPHWPPSCYFSVRSSLLCSHLVAITGTVQSRIPCVGPIWSDVSFFRDKREKFDHWNLSWTTPWAAWHQVCHPAEEESRKMLCLHKLKLLPGK